MKKFIYVCMLFLASVMARGETGFIVSDNAKKAFTFDTWIDADNLPFGWFRGSPHSNGEVTNIEYVSNRYEEDNKAVKFTADITNTGTTWHVNVKLLTNPTDQWTIDRPDEFCEFSVPLETDFYYTFWAKSDTPGNKLYIGTLQMYNPGNFSGAAWNQMPATELTTNWTKYAVLVSKELTPADKNINNMTALTEFTILFRESGVQYIDDIEIGLGHDLPDDVGHFFIDGVEYDANGIPVVPPHPDFIISANAKKAFTFDEISTSNRPWGWRIGNTTTHGTVPGRELVANRYQEADKAIKLTAEVTNSAATWHVSVDLITPDNSAASSYPDEVSEFSIPFDIDFYYTFWAKSEVEGEKLYICPSQVYNSGNFNEAAWNQMPATELTTNWTKYAIKISKDQIASENKKGDNFTALSTFSILFRGEVGTHIQYIDDIEFGLGHNLPNDIGHYFINGIEYDADGNPLSPLPSPVATDQNGQEYDFSTDIPALSSDITSLKLSGPWSSENYEDLEQNLSNPNCLIYVPENIGLPNTNSSVNYIVGGVALNNIVLVDSDPANGELYPYHCPESFHLGDNSIIYELTNFDFASRTNGWNTLAIPFDGVLKIDGIDKTPSSSDEDSAGEYWLKEYTSSSNNEVLFSHTGSGKTIKKNTPYLLAIPGKDAFGENGYETEKVTIEATNIFINATPDAAGLKQTVSPYSFVCNYQITEKADIYVIERGEGSAADSFAQYDKNEVLPFRAYFEGGSDQVSRLTIGNGGGTGFNLIQKDEGTMNIYVQGSSVVIESNEATVVKVYNVDGQLVKTITVEVGINKVNGLQQGVYIIGGQKVIISQ